MAESSSTELDAGAHATRRTTRRSPRGEQRRREIIDTAVRMFAEGGYNAVSLAQIADAVGISQPGLIHHFPTKSHLLIAAIQDREDRREPKNYPSLLALLGVLRENEQTPILVKLNAVISAEALVEDHPAHDWIRDLYTTRVKYYTEGVEELIDPEKLPVGMSASDLARLLVATNEGVRWEWVLEGQSFSRAERMAQHLELLRPYFRDPHLDVSVTAVPADADLTAER